MIEIRMMNKYRQYRVYTVYENIQEMEDNNINPVPYHLAQPGDYIQTDNGYYIPIVSRAINGKFLRLRGPMCEWYGLKRENSQKSIDNNYMVFNRMPIPKKYDAKLKPSDFLFAQLVMVGTPLHAALRIAFPMYKTNLSKKLKNILRNNNLINHIKDTVMAKLSSVLEEEGVTYESIAKLIGDTIKKPDNLNEKKWAVDAAINLINTAKEETIREMQDSLPHQCLPVSPKSEPLQLVGYEIVP